MARVLELERVRTRIATDLHNDLGASLSRIALLSEVVRQRLTGEQQEAGRLLGEVAGSARRLHEAMSDIVWSIDPRKDRLEDFVRRIRGFASEILEPSGIRWRLEAQPELERVKLRPEQRRHLLLIVKEAIHNVVRHAGASEVAIAVDVDGSALKAEVRDDGRGFDERAVAELDGLGNGLRNMRGRAEELRGKIRISSEPGQGTHLSLVVPI